MQPASEQTHCAVPPVAGNRYDRMEWAGAFGDLGTLIPFIVALLRDRPVAVGLAVPAMQDDLRPCRNPIGQTTGRTPVWHLR
jgi:hypothetical protein